MKKIFLLITFILTSNLVISQTKKKKSNYKNTTAQYYSEEKALDLIADYYEFYNADEEYDTP